MPDTDQEKETIYTYIANFKAPHPLNPEITQIRARAVTASAEKAEFFGKTIEQIKAQVVSHDYGRQPGSFRLVWVDSPDDHPTLKKILEKESAPAPSRPAPSPEESWERADLAVLRSQHHICDSCQVQKICAFATHPAFHEQLVTIAGCLSYRSPKDHGQEKEDQEKDPAPEDLEGPIS